LALGVSNFFEPCKKDVGLKIAQYSKWARFHAVVLAAIKKELVKSVHIIAEAAIMKFMRLLLRL
jgi:hypothetical protein